MENYCKVCKSMKTNLTKITETNRQNITYILHTVTYTVKDFHLQQTNLARWVVIDHRRTIVIYFSCHCQCQCHCPSVCPNFALCKYNSPTALQSDDSSQLGTWTKKGHLDRLWISLGNQDRNNWLKGNWATCCWASTNQTARKLHKAMVHLAKILQDEPALSHPWNGSSVARAWLLKNTTGSWEN